MEHARLKGLFDLKFFKKLGGFWQFFAIPLQTGMQKNSENLQTCALSET